MPWVQRTWRRRLRKDIVIGLEAARSMTVRILLGAGGCRSAGIPRKFTRKKEKVPQTLLTTLTEKYRNGDFFTVYSR